MAKNIAAEVEPMIRPVAAQLGCELSDLTFIKEGANWVLRIFIDKEGGVTIDDCEQVSRAAEKVLDENDPIEQSYILEVSSPGLDRPLKREQDFVQYKGRLVDVKLYRMLEKRKEFRGSLEGLQDNCVVITDEEGVTRRFAKADVASCKLAVLL
ncbi:MAG: ribosome maturation factor RimP [Clostridiales bacterium]|jgi:ribosome maturation factor RimP|nr:ribosome maturation factor RimP [Clostridiales bacterium]